MGRYFSSLGCSAIVYSLTGISQKPLPELIYSPVSIDSTSRNSTKCREKLLGKKNLPRIDGFSYYSGNNAV
jgi:hypothetical protein